MTGQAERQALERALQALGEAATAIRALLRDGEVERIKARPVRRPPPADGLIEVGAAAERFGVPADTIRKWCRKKAGLGERRGGRWYVRIAELRHLAEKR